MWLFQILKLGKLGFVCARFSQPTVKSKHYITWLSDLFLSVLFYLLFFLSSVCELPVEIVLFNQSFKFFFNFTFPWFLFQIWGVSISAVDSDDSVGGCHFLSQLKDLTKNQEAKEPQKLHFLIDCVFTSLLSLFSFSVPRWSWITNHCILMLTVSEDCVWKEEIRRTI